MGGGGPAAARWRPRPVEYKPPAGRRRLRKVANVCEDFGQRVQNSVFECLVDAEQWTRLEILLLAEFDAEQDSLRFYFLGRNWRRRVEHHGVKEVTALDEPLIL